MIGPGKVLLDSPKPDTSSFFQLGLPVFDGRVVFEQDCSHFFGGGKETYKRKIP